MEFPKRSLIRNDPARVITREYYSIVTSHVKSNAYSYVVFTIICMLIIASIVSISLIFDRPIKNVKVIEELETAFASEEEVGWNTWHHVNQIINVLKEYPEAINYKYRMNSRYNDKNSWDDPFSWDNQYYGGSVFYPVERQNQS